MIVRSSRAKVGHRQAPLKHNAPLNRAGRLCFCRQRCIRDYLTLRRAKASPINPIPINNSVPGSGSRGGGFVVQLVLGLVTAVPSEKNAEQLPPYRI